MHEIWKFDQMQDFTTESSQLLQYKFKLKIIVGFVWFDFEIKKMPHFIVPNILEIQGRHNVLEPVRNCWRND